MKASFKKIPASLLLLAFVLLTYYFFDWEHLWASGKQLWNKPGIVIAVMAAYFLSFTLKAAAWKAYLKGRPRFTSCLLGLFYSLLINHILPVKAGDIVRTAVLPARDKQITAEEAIHSVIILRTLDMACLAAIALAGIVVFDLAYQVPYFLLLLILVSGLTAFIYVKRSFPEIVDRHWLLLKGAFSGFNSLSIFLLTLTSWLLEAAVLYGTVLALGGKIPIFEAVWVNSITIAGQVFQITPGGIASYEAVMSFALNLVGFPLNEGYTLALLTHGLKFLFSYLAGTVSLLVFPVSLKMIKKWIKQRG
ncbi:lysylphosphatidylglycerol synthetase family protein [Bacillus sp. V3-13]|uniref:lysylphosphatidylglycerol synthase transmembrane domain-containing protein n=1 Tax=Bacillus sp. V3-13 TaxID=2053728 RepID=UPI000C78B86B|nr:lysylphosphatidylglycerol synthase transmembrane domain-containing protein [Bacillus sp. V3-13]PLR77736.1 lysylphosphatidylglycerol synthetase family protein [Bacillus sp. V3-13]